MKNSKNKRAIILATILLGLLIIGYKVIFTSPDENFLVEENNDISVDQKIEKILNEVEKISFNIDIIKESKFNSLRSIEISLPILPIGKKNPFSP